VGAGGGIAARFDPQTLSLQGLGLIVKQDRKNRNEDGRYATGGIYFNTTAKQESQIELLRRLIKSSGESQRAISKATGISPAMICRLVKENRGLSTDYADKLLQHFGYEITRKKGRQENEKAAKK